jgi:UDP-N-acetylmuramoyl-L-alanyl-D-glutamate--2,6-diaminopimelate ligase
VSVAVASDNNNPRPRANPPAALTSLVSAWPTDLTVAGVTMDSRAVHPGDVYLAPAGARAHGADFAEQAVAAGAIAVITDSDGVARAGVSVPVLEVTDVRGVAGYIADVVYGQPSSQLTMVGVTGTNGKTTMSHLIESVFAAAGRVPGLIGTTGHRAAGRLIPTKHTTPEAPVVHALLAVMQEEGVQAVVMEVSSHALHFQRVNGVAFDVAVFTNLTQDHLDFHGTMSDYFRTKAQLFKMSDTAVVCIDDEWGQRLAAEHPHAITYSVANSEATWSVVSWQPTADGTLAHILGPDGPKTLQTPLPGEFNVANALGAAAVGHTLGFDWQHIVDGIANCAGVPGRMQRVADTRVHAFVDYAHTPDAVERAITAAPSPAVVVLGCGGDRDIEKRPRMGSAAARLARVVVVTDDNPRSEDPAAIRAAMIEGAHEVPEGERAQIVEIGDRAQAIRAAVDLARPGDSVLVLGKGHERNQDFGPRGIQPFDDTTELRTALEEAHA